MAERRSRKLTTRDDSKVITNESQQAIHEDQVYSPSQQHYSMEQEQQQPFLDVTVLAFAQWVSELRQRQHTSQHQMQAEMSIIRNAISTNNQDLGDFKRHSAAIQQHMQKEISEIRESLSSVFMEITAAVRNNACADQDLKMKIQALNEQVVRNETAFAQLADAADQSQSKLRAAVQEMQHSGERMRDDLVSVNRYSEQMDTNSAEKFDRLMTHINRLEQDQQAHHEHKKEHAKRMLKDVHAIDESLHTLIKDLDDLKQNSDDVFLKLQASVATLEESEKEKEREIARADNMRRSQQQQQQVQHQQQLHHQQQPMPMQQGPNPDHQQPVGGFRSRITMPNMAHPLQLRSSTMGSLPGGSALMSPVQTTPLVAKPRGLPLRGATMMF